MNKIINGAIMMLEAGKNNKYLLQLKVLCFQWSDNRYCLTENNLIELISPYVNIFLQIDNVLLWFY